MKQYLSDSWTLASLEDVNVYIGNEKPSNSKDMSKVKMIVEQARMNNLTKFI